MYGFYIYVMINVCVLIEYFGWFELCVFIYLNYCLYVYFGF